jgi:hypothetical protein
MTIHFAAARSRKLSVMARVLSAPIHRIAANDNGRHTAHYTPFADNAVLRATLRHFAEHGLAAAERARENAERAIFAGDRDQYEHWLAICRGLDRRMAAGVTACHSKNSSE